MKHIDEIARLTEGILGIANECNCRAEHGADGALHLLYMEKALRELVEIPDDQRLKKAARAVVDSRYDMGDASWDKLKNAIGELEDIVGRTKK